MLSLITSERLVELPGWTPWLILLALVVFWSEIFAMWQYPDKIFCTFSAYAQDKTAVSQFRRRFNRTCTDCNRTTNVTVHYTYWVIQVSLLNGIGDSAICSEALMQMGINSNFSFKSLSFLKVGNTQLCQTIIVPLDCQIISIHTVVVLIKGNGSQRGSADCSKTKKDTDCGEKYHFCTRKPAHTAPLSYQIITKDEDGSLQQTVALSLLNKNLLIFFILYPTRRQKNGHWHLEQLPQCFNSGVSL